MQILKGNLDREEKKGDRLGNNLTTSEIIF